MRTWFMLLIITIGSLSLIVNEASAKRFGGGRSFGTYRTAKSYQTPFKKNTFNRAKSNVTKNRWGGLLGGLLIGSLLTSLFMGHGIGQGLFSWLIIGVLAAFIISWLKRRMQPQFNTANGYHQASADSVKSDSLNFNAFTHLNQTASNIDFDEEAFLRQAKVTFIRLQKAYDDKNLTDIQQFTSPSVFAEIKIQFSEREQGINQTDVQQLNAQMRGYPTPDNDEVASVTFSGIIKEENNPAESFEETWHFKQAPHSNEWLVEGIQQKSNW
ncbi:MAG: hypothetical protein CMF38_02210 [Legionellaceae bacterium]|nr:hypothetical protein [Legionellaceae bacterium]HCA89391.1 hypothetical protein [Legionellales bacterium]|tara:strand:+ start:5684 stop:6493 length:810 start_codon:yes stop_codon:yes gene_type:complete